MTTTTESPFERLAALAPPDRETLLGQMAVERGLPVAQLKARLLGSWRFMGRPKQQPPVGDWTFWLILAGRGFGKLADVETPVATPSGWTLLGEIEPGDLVFDESGRICPVTAVYDETPTRAYRLTFSDGTEAKVGEEHLWTTWDHAARKAYGRSPYESSLALPPEWPAWRLRRLHGQRGHAPELIEEALALAAGGMSARAVGRELAISRQSLAPHLRAGRYIEREPLSYEDSPGPQVRSTAEIVATLTHGVRDDANHSIPVCGPLDLPERRLPVDPYVLGAWLGDGSRGAGALTAHPDDHAHWYRELRAFSPHPLSEPLLVGTYGLRTRLREAGVLFDKHVPAIYLRASISQRLALLQGLMDTDGSAASSSVEFSNTNKRLVDAVVELARSLGQKPVVAESRSTLNGHDYGPKWRVTWRPTVEVFRMSRKAELVRPPGAQAFRNLHRMIVSAEEIPAEPMRCLTVASRHHTFLLGEGMIPTHNTLTGAKWTKDKAVGERCRIALIAPTLGDVRNTMVEGETGLLSVIPNLALLGQSREIAWNKSRLELTLANGTTLQGFSSEVPDRLRGPQHHYAWGEEVSSWEDANQGDALNSTFSNMKLGLRLGKHPQAALTTTPKANKLTREILKIPDRDLALVTGSSFENRGNLPEAWWRAVVAPLIGTRTGRQEISAEVLDDVEGALWTLAQIESAPRMAKETPEFWMPKMRRIVVAVDPNTTSGETSDDAGIVVAGLGHSDQHGYVLDDRTQTRGGPARWASAAVEAYHDWQADKIVAESNNGGEMVRLVIKSVDPTVPVKLITASRGKRTRAEPVATLYGSVEHPEENPGRVHHCGVFPEMEDEMTTWTGTGDSPNRMDALVWALTELKLWTPTQRRGSFLPTGEIPGVVQTDRYSEDFGY